MADSSSSSNAAPSAPSEGITPSQEAVVPQQVPGSQPATSNDGTQAPGSTETKPSTTSSLDSLLSDESKAYLKSQGVTDFNADGLNKFIENHKTLRAEKSKDSQPNTSQAVEMLNNMSGVTTQSVTTQKVVDAQDTNINNQQGTVHQEQKPGLPSEVEMFNFTNNLANMYPSLASNIKSGQLYKDMGDFGIQPIVNGSFNVNAVLKFAELQNKQVSLQAELDKAKEPSHNSVPELKQSVDNTQPLASTMTPDTANAILAFSIRQQKAGLPVHPQFEEARNFFTKK